MKITKSWLTRSAVEKQLGLTPHQFVVLRREGRIVGYTRPGYTRPEYKATEIAALKTQLEQEVAAV